MADVTVKQLADTVGTPVEKLLQQLKDAGVDKNAAEDTIDASEKAQLLTFLRQSQGCLLYTSPSPRDATLSRMPSSA